MYKVYLTEREGQIEFFDNFRINYKDNEVLVDNTDGVWNGNLFEFKLNIDNLNKVLFQAIKYLSRMRVKGENIPSNILLVSLNTSTLYLYKTEDYFEEIHKIYSGSASKDNEGFVAKSPTAKFDYSIATDTITVQGILKSNVFVPIRLDEDCIVGWVERYYNELPKANKGDFLGDETGKIKVIGEIREPKHFKGLILPYENKTNEKFKYLMDKLNDRLSKKDLGAFYTPIPYCEKAAELVRMAIERVPKGNDYVIIDRCAGTGNLESVLTDEELSHCILSTYEYYEYKVLCERLSDKVRFIVPPTENLVKYSNGCVINADAMSEEYINNPDIKAYIDNPNCTIILYENPPYRDAGAVDTNNTKGFKNYVNKKMCEETLANKTVAYDLANMFIWSGYKYYLRQPTDSYILFSPIKYWKMHDLSSKKMLKGFAFNRKHFHATPSTITCILWGNEDDMSNTISVEPLDIIGDKVSVVENKPYIQLEKVKIMSNKYLPATSTFSGEKGIICGMDGAEVFKKCRGKALYNPDYFAYLRLNGFNLDALNRTLTTVMNYAAMGRYLTKENYQELLPLFVAKLFPEDVWYERDIYATTADGGDKYTKDKDFLKYCLIYTCLSNQNKCLSFKGSDGRYYQNELCFEKNSLAYTDLQKYKTEIGFNFEEEELILIWDKILVDSKQTNEYDSKWNYGIYQITKELNTTQIMQNIKGKEEKVYNYPELNGNLTTLRIKLKEYYNKYITPKMFEHGLIK